MAQNAVTTYKYNGGIEMLRYLFTTIVALMHFWTFFYEDGFFFEWGYIAVDFFFMLSGLYLAASLLRKPSNPFLWFFNKWGG